MLDRDVSIEIDALTLCLRNRRTKEIVKTEFHPVGSDEVMNLQRKNWNFDWSEPLINGYEVYKLCLRKTRTIQGLVALKPEARSHAVHIDIVEAAPHNIGKAGRYEGVGGHLFAIAAKKSKEYGFNGFTYFTAKSTLIEHYMKALGAIVVNPRLRIMAIDELAAKNLINKYFEE